MVDISFGDKLSILHLFRTCTWLVTGGDVLSFCLRWARKCFSLPVTLQYLKYQIMLTNITMARVPSIVIIISNQLVIRKGYFSSIYFKTFFTCSNETLFIPVSLMQMYLFHCLRE